jgi:hypothetical protein
MSGKNLRKYILEIPGVELWDAALQKMKFPFRESNMVRIDDIYFTDIGLAGYHKVVRVCPDGRHLVTDYIAKPERKGAKKGCAEILTGDNIRIIELNKS